MRIGTASNFTIPGFFWAHETPSIFAEVAGLVLDNLLLPDQSGPARIMPDSLVLLQSEGRQPSIDNVDPCPSRQWTGPIDRDWQAYGRRITYDENHNGSHSYW